ncbi:MAG TPA: hypothetical protein VH020_12590, partial [Stellaceae bacterium]|jgi:hypothetical protein|nr:hypothetical protein [Stellaceae bacterium]
MTVTITKEAAAQRQLDAAIRWLFANDDILPIHSVAAAAGEVLRSLAEKHGVTIEDDAAVHAMRRVFQAFDGTKRTDQELRRELPQAKKWIRIQQHKPANFLKHADKDADMALAIDELDVDTDHVLLQACAYYVALDLPLTPEIEAFGRWHLAVYPNEPGDEIVTAVGKVDKLNRLDQLDFGAFLLDLAEDGSVGDDDAGSASPNDKVALVREALDQVKKGQTIPSEEIEAWIESWDTPNELPTPTPHKH